MRGCEWLVFWPVGFVNWYWVHVVSGEYWDENILCRSVGKGVRLEFDNWRVCRIFFFGRGKTHVHAVDKTVLSTRV
jgi:hypothetical protein